MINTTAHTHTHTRVRVYKQPIYTYNDVRTLLYAHPRENGKNVRNLKPDRVHLNCKTISDSDVGVRAVCWRARETKKKKKEKKATVIIEIGFNTD